jgi:hypothetical protein
MEVKEAFKAGGGNGGELAALAVPQTPHTKCSGFSFRNVHAEQLQGPSPRFADEVEFPPS